MSLSCMGYMLFGSRLSDHRRRQFATWFHGACNLYKARPIRK